MKRVRKALLVTAALAIVLAVFLAGCSGTAGVPLKYSFEEGDSFTYDFDMTLNGKVEGPGVPAGQGTLPPDTNMKMRMSLAVEDVTDGIATVRYKYESPEMTSGGKALPLPLDSMPEIILKIDEQGKILSVEGLEEILPPGFSMSNLPFDPSQIGAQTNVIFPEGGVAEPGDTWQAKSTYPIPGSPEGIESTVTGKLLSVSEEDGREVAEVEFTVSTPMDLTLDLGAIMAEMGLDKMLGGSTELGDMSFKMSMAGSQDMKGVARVDTGNGMPVDLNGDLAMNLSIQVIDAPAEVVPEDQRGPMTVDMMAKVALKQVK